MNELQDGGGLIFFRSSLLTAKIVERSSRLRVSLSAFGMYYNDRLCNVSPR